MAGASILVISSWLRRPWPFGYRGSLAASESSWQRGGGAQMAGLTGSAPGWCLDRQAESGPALALAPSPGSLGTLLCPEVSSTLLPPPLLLRSAQIPDRANLSFPPSIPRSCGPAQAGRGYASGAGVVGGGVPLKFKEARASARCWLGEIKTEELAGTGRQKWERSYTGVSCCSINNGTKV